jgi:putative spermidine/putrescine transport system permease protein
MSFERAGSWLLLAFNVAFFIFLLAPIVVVVMVSFTPELSVSVPYHGFSMRWYQRIIDYKPFMASLKISLLLALASAALAVFIAIPAAIGLGRSTTRISSVIVTLLLAPIAIPALVVGFSLLYFMSGLGIGVSFFALLIAHTVISIPYVMRTVLAVYRGLGINLEEASAILGADEWQTFQNVTLPLIGPGIFAGALFAVLVSLDNLPVSYFFGTANVTTLPVVMLSYLQNQFDPSIAAISTVQMLIAVILLFILERTYGLRALNAR